MPLKLNFKRLSLKPQKSKNKLTKKEKKNDNNNFNDDSESDVHSQRKRLSIANVKGYKAELLDGAGNKTNNISYKNTDSKYFKECSVISKVGFSPYNPLKVNQDMGIILSNIIINNDKSCSLIGAFDGHGVEGEKVSQFLVNQMTKWFNTCKDNINNINKINYGELITLCFEDLTTKLKNTKKIDCTSAGSTGVTVLFDNEKYYCGNVGDSRIVLGRYNKELNKIESISLSIDQKPDNEKEKNRIINNGGRVEQFKDQYNNPVGPYRVWLKHQPFPGLAMSRSFGDDIATSVGVISVPEIIIKNRDINNDKYIIAASDGVWEFITNDEAINIVSKYNDSIKASQALVNESTKRWKNEEQVIDDITAVVAFL